MRRLCISLSVLTSVFLLGNTLSMAADARSREVIAIQFRPAAAPQPALRYRLLPTPFQQRPGNAAPLYLKALLLLTEAKTTNEEWEKITAWTTTPLDKLPRDEMRKTLDGLRSAIHQAELAAVRTHCDWDPPIREERNIFEILLPEMQAARNVARLLAVRARLRIAEGKYDDALADLRTGYALAGHTASAPFLVSGLVGLAIANLMHDQVQTLVQTPDAPNLYWALTAMPNPPASLRTGLDTEEAVLPLMFPELCDLKSTRTSEQWTNLLARLTDVLAMTGSGASTVPAALGVAAALPGAKQRLIDAGFDRKEVEAMVPAQALLIQTMQSVNQHRDAVFKWSGVPYWQAAAGLRQAEADLQQAKKTLTLLNPDLGLIMAGMLLPAIGQCHLSEAKGCRRVGELRTIEAIRAYAAAHGGKLPAQLADIEDLPLPVNAVTGKPFAYRLDGDTAVLGGDDPANTQPREYRLKAAK